jgi:adenosylhomocysteine nucleosidase
MMHVVCMLFLFCAPELIGVMGAMDVELELIHEDMTISRTDTIAQRVFTVGTLHNIPCVTVRAGIGKVNSAMTSEILIQEYGVDAVLFTGVAGGIDPDLYIGDIVISERVVHHDLGDIGPDTFVVWDTVGYQADSALVELIMQAVMTVRFKPIPAEMRRGKNLLPRVKLGIVATGDQFIASEEKRQWIERTLHAACVEMEGAAVAQVCTIHGIPFVIIRSLSDLANEDADIDFASFVDYAAANSNAIVKALFLLLGDSE